MRGMMVAVLVAIAGAAQAQTVFTVSMDGAQVPTASTFTGSGTVTLNLAQNQITVALTHNIPNANVTDGHIHTGTIGVNGAPAFASFPGGGTSPINAVIAVSPAQVAILQAEGYYVNIHTVAFGGGEIRGQILAPVVAAPIRAPWLLAAAAGIAMFGAGALAVRRRRRA